MRQYTRKPVADKVLPIVRAVFDEQDRQGVTNAELARRSGFERRNLTAIRRGRQGIGTFALQALADTLQVELTAQPKSAPAGIDAAGLQMRLRDLRTSIQNHRHHDDLKSEIEDIIFETLGIDFS